MNKNNYTLESKLNDEQKTTLVSAVQDVSFAVGYVAPLIRESDDTNLIDTVVLCQQEAADIVNFIKSGVDLTCMTLVMLNNSLKMLKSDFHKIESYLWKIHSKHAEGLMFRGVNLDEAFSLDRNC